MVVPTRPARITAYPALNGGALTNGFIVGTYCVNCGGSKCKKAIAHSGFARNAETTYAKYTRQMVRNILSTRLADPCTTKTHTNIAANGTDTNLLMPNTSVA